MEIGRIGEFGLIGRIQEIVKTPSDRIKLGIGDDAAIFSTRPGYEMLISTDALVEGVHFDLRYTPLDALGWKALAVNLSDLAAMAADPLCAVISVAIPNGWSVEEVEKFYQGLRACSETYGCPVVGGDTTRSPAGSFFSITVIGEAPHGQAVRRSGATAGDAICVSGVLGGARTGFEILSAGADEKDYADSIHRFLRPAPRLELGRRVAEELGATAMIDISDGLASEIGHLCKASGHGCRIDGSSLPIHPEATRWTSFQKQDAMDFVLSSGEEYELLFTVPKEREGEIVRLQTEGCPVAKIGEMRPAAEGQSLIQKNGEKTSLRVQGWNHFLR